MDNKLQALTDKLYNEGLSKGKQEGEELLQKAHAEAEGIIAQAKAEAERIIAQANKEADELKTKVAADVRMAATQSIAVTKQEIEKTIDTLNDAFENLFDNMFEDTNLDISTDAEVMRTLLEQEGLTGTSWKERDEWVAAANQNQSTNVDS